VEPQAISEKAKLKATLVDISRKLKATIREHFKARVKGSGKVSPLVAMAERIAERERNRNRLET